MSAPRLLIIDDNAINGETLRLRLVPLGYEVALETSVQAGLARLEQERIELVFLNVMMDGCEVCRRIRARQPVSFLPIIMVTTLDSPEHKIQGLEAGADDFLSWPFSGPELVARTRSLLRLKQLHDQLDEQVAERTRALTDALEELTRVNADLMLAEEETILRLARAAESRDGETANHLLRMSAYSELLARKLKLPEVFINQIRLASMMHDVGKIGIPDRLLHSSGTYSHEERQEMAIHPRLGAEILSGSRSQLLQMGERIALTHHEWYDGTGYPRKLREEEIPIEGRIVALADFYDALASRRRYKEPVPADRVFEMIRQRSGTHFDPRAVQAFLEARDEVLEIQTRLNEVEAGLAAFAVGSEA